jgi:membrane protease YdiL (CAAX protease family)
MGDGGHAFRLRPKPGFGGQAALFASRLFLIANIRIGCRTEWSLVFAHLHQLLFNIASKTGVGLSASCSNCNLGRPAEAVRSFCAGPAVLTMFPSELPTETSRTEQSEPVRSGPRPFGFWGALGWALFALATTTFAAFIYVALWSLSHHGAIPRIGEDFTVIETVLWIVPVVVFAVAVKRRHYLLRDYFALNGIPRRDLALGIAGIVALAVVFDSMERLLGIDAGSASVAATYQATKLAGMLPVLWLAAVVVAPVTEELIFRGFLHRSWERSRLGVSGTIILTSALWTAMHSQYSGFGLLDIFASGLLLGWLRHRSASTTLTIVLHAINNVLAMLLIAIQVDWLS